MNNYEYAKLGYSCQTSMAVLTSNTKFFPMNDDVYNLRFTKTHAFAGPRHDDERRDGSSNSILRTIPADKDNKDVGSMSSCCGRNNY